MEKLSRTQRFENLRNDVDGAETNQNVGVFNNTPPLQATNAFNQAPPFGQTLSSENQQIVNPFATQAIPVVQSTQSSGFVDPFAQTTQQTMQQQSVVPQFPNMNQQFAQAPLPQQVQQALPQPQPFAPVASTTDQFSPYGPLPINQMPATSSNTAFRPNQPLYPSNDAFGGGFGQANTMPNMPNMPMQTPTMSTSGMGTTDTSYIDSVLREAKMNSIAQGQRTAEDTNLNIVDQMIRSGTLPQGAAQMPIQQQGMGYQAPPLGSVIPNPASTREADLAYENTVRQEAQMAYQQTTNDLSLDQQISLINNPNMIPAQMPTATVSQQQYQQPVELQQAGVEAKPFVTGKLPVVSDIQINTYVEDSSSAVGLDSVIQQRIQGDSEDITNRIIKYEGELDDVTDNVTYTNKVLNIILIFLILGLTVVLCVVIWWILTVRGII